MFRKAGVLKNKAEIASGLPTTAGFSGKGSRVFLSESLSWSEIVSSTRTAHNRTIQVTRRRFAGR